MFYLEVFKGGRLRQNFLQRLTQLGYVPLPVAKIVEIAILGLLSCNLERCIENAIRRLYSEVLRKH